LALSKGIGLILIVAVYQPPIFSACVALALAHPMASGLNGALLLIDKASMTSLYIRPCPAIPANQSL
jgi:hypothetical protein